MPELAPTDAVEPLGSLALCWAHFAFSPVGTGQEPKDSRTRHGWPTRQGRKSEEPSRED